MQNEIDQNKSRNRYGSCYTYLRPIMRGSQTYVKSDTNEAGTKVRQVDLNHFKMDQFCYFVNTIHKRQNIVEKMWLLKYEYE